MNDRLKNIIEFNNCKNGYLYRIEARNAHLGIFNKEKDGFIILRTKFSSRYLFVELHWDRDDHFGTAQPIEELELFKDIPSNFNEFITKSSTEEDRKLYKEMFDYLDKANERFPDKERLWSDYSNKENP